MAVPLIINTAVLFYHHSKDELTGFRFLTYFGNDSMVLVLVGSVILLSVYGDELRSMAMTTLIGRGYSRTNIILAKFIDVVLLVIAVNIFYAVIALVLMLAFRVPLTYYIRRIFHIFNGEFRGWRVHLPCDIRADSGADSICEQHNGVCSEISP